MGEKGGNIGKIGPPLGDIDQAISYKRYSRSLRRFASSVQINGGPFNQLETFARFVIVISASHRVYRAYAPSRCIITVIDASSLDDIVRLVVSSYLSFSLFPCNLSQR